MFRVCSVQYSCVMCDYTEA